MIDLPEGWEIILDRDVIGYNILKKYCNEYTLKMVHHLSWGNVDASNKIIDAIMFTVKENLRDIKGITNLFNNAFGLLEIEDTFKISRIKYFLSLDDISEAQNESIFNYLISFRDESPFNTLVCLKLLGDLIKKFALVMNYVCNNANVI
jgi:hypothetical protein